MQNIPINNNGIMQGQTAKEVFPTPADNQSGVANVSILGLSKTEWLEQAVNDLRMGRRIQEELKRQGRTTTWLARQLGMERTSLYYTFRQNSIDVELLLRISSFIEHNFLQDVADVYKAYGL